jgi:sialic acid synthase SpsE
MKLGATKTTDYFLILEAGVNHNGNLDEALELVRSAARTGAHAIKFQTYTANKLAAPTSPSYWNLEEESTTSQIELFKKYDGLQFTDYQTLASECKKLDIEFMTTCFDEDWVEVMDPLVEKYKIASADITNLPLLRRIASKMKPIFLSTGASTFEEIHIAVQVIQEESNSRLCIMHCVLNYPTDFSNANLERIRKLSEEFPNLEIGYSDHTRPEYSDLAIIQAHTLGATSFEKHFTLDKGQKGNDHYHSYDETDVLDVIGKLDSSLEMRKFSEPNFIAIQESARSHARRGIYARRDLVAGESLNLEDLIMLRPIPPNGISAAEIDSILGRKLTSNIKEGSQINLNSML